ncbi:protein phosphatase PHLPP-like protein [Trichonephila clavipes]|nr:protein phosphatase PHLPP-like protein [Trichonephila clavipes]
MEIDGVSIYRVEVQSVSGYGKFHSFPSGRTQQQLKYHLKLKRLHCDFNHLGSLPLDWSSLVSLTSLTLSNNRLDQLPTTIWTLQCLEVLNLQRNRISVIDPLPEGAASRLKELRLSWNRLSGTLDLSPLGMNTPNYGIFIDLDELGNETRGHGTTPLRVKEDIEDVSSELGNGDKRLHFLYKTSRTLLLLAPRLTTDAIDMVNQASENILLCLTTRGLLATDHVILSPGQVTWTTPELAPPVLTLTPHQREDGSALDRFNVHRCPKRRVFSGTGGQDGEGATSGGSLAHK